MILIAGQRFKDYPCLFLFDDLWCLNGTRTSIVQDLSNITLHEGGRTAFTTRDTKLRGGKIILFEARERRGVAAQNMLLSRASLNFPVRDDSARAFHSVLDVCAGLPLMISLVGAVIRVFAEEDCRNDPEAAWQIYIDENKSGVVENGPKTQMRKAVLASLDVAEKFEKGRSFRQKFLSLSVVRNQRTIPIRVVERLWGVDNVEAKSRIRTLQRFSIINVRTTTFHDEVATSIGLHDLVLEIARDLSTEYRSMGNPFALSLIESYVLELCQSRLNVDLSGTLEVTASPPH